MASSSFSFSLLNLKQHFSAIFLFVNIITLIIPQGVTGCFTSIFSFGDSLTDTGNLLHMSLAESGRLPYFAFPPYGKTFFHHPTGRFSDGRLIIDFIAEEFGLPFLPPYFGGINGTSLENFQKGVNFAVAGATALDDAFFKERGITNPATNVSLGVEIGFFKDVLSTGSLCSSASECKEILGNSFIVMGEIGGDDYGHAFNAGKSAEEAREFVPLVVDAIASAINELIELGALTFLVPGVLPGCSPSRLTYFQGLDKSEYDPLTDCITWVNQFAEYHNEMLQKELDRIRDLHPHVNIVYADYYNAAINFYRSPNQFGFTEETKLKACCGSGGLYNYNPSMACGDPGVRSCDDPSSYISWDGTHYTEAAYRYLSNAVLEGLYTIPSIRLKSLCPSFTVNNKLSSV